VVRCSDGARVLHCHVSRQRNNERYDLRLDTTGTQRHITTNNSTASVLSCSELF